MTLKAIAELLEAKVLCGHDRLNEEHETAFASDLMSDILTLGDNFPMIVTGLCTMQTIRTAEMGNLDIIVFARNVRYGAEYLGHVFPEVLPAVAGYRYYSLALKVYLF